MTTNLKQLVHALRVGNSGHTNEYLQRQKGRASLLYSPDEAADIDLETVLENALIGLESLSNLDERFANFVDDIFNSSDLKRPRELCNQMENKIIDRALGSLLRLISPYFTLPAAHAVLEYLVRHYKIYHYNVDEVVACILPWHDTKIFVRMAQLLNIDKHQDHGKWEFLAQVGKSGLPLDREVLAQIAAKNFQLLQFLCDATKRVDSNSNGEYAGLYSFFTVVIIEAIKSMRYVSERNVQIMLPMILLGLKATESPTFQSGTYMIVTQLCKKTSISNELSNVLLLTLCRPNSCISGLKHPLNCILSIVQSQENMVEFPLEPFKLLIQNPELPGLLSEISDKFDTQILLKLLISRFIEYLDGNQDEQVDESVESFLGFIQLEYPTWPANSFPDLTAWASEMLLDRFSQGEAGNSQMDDLRFARYSSVLGALVQQFSARVDSALQSFLASSNNSDSVLELVKKTFERIQMEHHLPVYLKAYDSGIGEQKEVGLPLLLALKHTSHQVRQQAILSLSKAFPSWDESVNDLTEPLLSLLHDDNDAVVSALNAALQPLKCISNIGMRDSMLAVCVMRLSIREQKILSQRKHPFLANQVEAMVTLINVIGEIFPTEKSVENAEKDETNLTELDVMSKIIDLLNLNGNGFDNSDALDSIYAIKLAAVKCISKLGQPIFEMFDGTYGQSPIDKTDMTDEKMAEFHINSVKWLANGILGFLGCQDKRTVLDKLQYLKDLCKNCQTHGKSLLIESLAECTKICKNERAFSHTDSTLNEDNSLDENGTITKSSLTQFFIHQLLSFGDECFENDVILKFIIETCPHLRTQDNQIMSFIYEDHAKGSNTTFCRPFDVLLYLIGRTTKNSKMRKQACIALYKHCYEMRILPVLTSISTHFHLNKSTSYEAVMALCTSATYLKSLKALSRSESIIDTLSDAAAALPSILSLLSMDNKVVRKAGLVWVQSLSELLLANKLNKKLDHKIQLDVQVLYPGIKNTHNVTHELCHPGMEVISELCSFLGGSFLEEISSDNWFISKCIMNIIQPDENLKVESSPFLKYLLTHATILGYRNPIVSSVLFGYIERVSLDIVWPYVGPLLKYVIGLTDNNNMELLRVLTGYIGHVTVEEEELVNSIIELVADALDRPLDNGQPSPVQKLMLKVLTREWYESEVLTELHKATILTKMLLVEHKHGSYGELLTAKIAVNIKLSTLATVLGCIILKFPSYESICTPLSSKKKKKNDFHRVATDLVDNLPMNNSIAESVIQGLTLLIDYVILALDDSVLHLTESASQFRKMMNSLCEILNVIYNSCVHSTGSVTVEIDRCVMLTFNAIAALILAQTNHSVVDNIENQHINLVMNSLKLNISMQTQNSGMLLLAQMIESGENLSGSENFDEILDLMVKGLSANIEGYEFKVMQQLMLKILPIIRKNFSDNQFSAQHVIESLMKSLPVEVEVQRQRIVFETYVDALSEDIFPCLFCCTLAKNSSNMLIASELLNSVIHRVTPDVHVITLSNLLIAAQFLCFEAVQLDSKNNSMITEIRRSLKQEHYPPVITLRSVYKSYTNKAENSVEKSEGNPLFFGIDMHALLGKFGQKSGVLIQNLLKFVSMEVKNELFHVKIAQYLSTFGGDGLQREFLGFCENILVLLQIAKYCQALQQTGDQRSMWKSASLIGYEIFESIQSLLSVPSFVSVVQELLNSENYHLKLKGIQMLIGRLESTNSVEDNLYQSLITDLIVIGCKTVNLSKLTQEESMLRENALLCIHVMASSLSVMSIEPFVKCLNELCDLSVYASKMVIDAVDNGKDEIAMSPLGLTSGAFLCMSTLISLLKAKAFPKLSIFLPAMLDLLECTIRTSVTVSSYVLLQQTILTSTTVVALNLKQFLHPYLNRILTLTLDLRILKSPTLSSYVDKLLTTLVKTGIQPRLLIPSTLQVYNSGLPPKSVRKLHEFISEIATTLDLDDVKEQFEPFVAHFLLALDYRSMSKSATGSELDAVDSSVCCAVIATLLKLNERDLKSFVSRLCHWKNSLENNARPGSKNRVIGNIERSISFYTLFSKMGSAFKDIFVAYFSNVLVDMAEILNFSANSEAKVHTSQGQKRRRVSEKDHRNDDEYLSEHEGMALVQLNKHVLAGLTACFQYDKNGFIDSVRFSQILQPLTDQIDTQLILSLDMDQVDYIENYLGPCISNLAYSARGDSVWKLLVNAIIMKVGSSNWVVRFNSIRILDMCFRTIGEEFLGLLPECLPVLSECLEDENSQVVKSTRDMIKYVEDILGESVETYLN